jgi:hypothetical protein
MTISKEFKQALEQALKLKSCKMADYGVTEELHPYGLKGNFIDIMRKAKRLEALVWNEQNPQVDESLIDTYTDLLNYTLDGLVMAKRK